jgi:hypothetical protein
MMLARDLPDEAVATSPGCPDASSAAAATVIHEGVHVRVRGTLVCHIASDEVALALLHPQNVDEGLCVLGAEGVVAERRKLGTTSGEEQRPEEAHHDHDRGHDHVRFCAFVRRLLGAAKVSQQRRALEPDHGGSAEKRAYGWIERRGGCATDAADVQLSDVT